MIVGRWDEFKRTKSQSDTSLGAASEVNKRPMPRSTRHENSYAHQTHHTLDLGHDRNESSSILVSSSLFTHVFSSPMTPTDESQSSSSHGDTHDNSDEKIVLRKEHLINTTDTHRFSSQDSHSKGIAPWNQFIQSQDSTSTHGADDDLNLRLHTFDPSLSLNTVSSQHMVHPNHPLADTMTHRIKDTAFVGFKQQPNQSKTHSSRGRTKKNSKTKSTQQKQQQKHPISTHSIIRSESEDNTTDQSLSTVKVSNLHQPTLHLNSTFYDSSDASTLSSCSHRDATLKSTSITRQGQHSSFSTRNHKHNNNNQGTVSSPPIVHPISPHSRVEPENKNATTKKQTHKRLWLLNRKPKKQEISTSTTTTTNTSPRRTSLVSKLSHLLFSRSSSPMEEDQQEQEPNMSSQQGRRRSSDSYCPPSHPTYEYLDSVIQERWDGIDLLSLSVAYRPRVYDSSSSTTTTPTSFYYKNIGRVIVSQSLYPWTTSTTTTTNDSVFPVVVMDGYQPTGEDRWSISIRPREVDHNNYHHNDDTTTAVSFSSSILEQERKIQREGDVGGDAAVEYTSATTTMTYVEQIQKSTFHMPQYLLLSQMYTTCHDSAANNTIPRKSLSLYNQKHLFPLSSSCPMDTDEDIFLIQSMDHLKSIYNLVANHVENADFDLAIEVMEKLVRSLLILHGAHLDGGNDVHHVIGTAYHNLGVVQMWASHFEDALLSFHAAVRIRTHCTMSNSTCLSVSLSKLGIIHFALDHFEDALECFEGCLKMKLGLDYTSSGELQNISSIKMSLDPSSLEIGKIMNNLGMAFFHNGQYLKSLHYLTQSLEYYKSWIESPLKRESLLFDASVVIGNVGRVYLEQGDFEMALYMYEEAFMLHSSYLKPKSMILVTSLVNVAFAKAKCRDYSRALKILGSVYKNHVERSGSWSCLALEIKALVCLVLIHQCEFSKAYEEMKDVLIWQHHELHHSHPAVMITTTLLSEMKTLMETEV